MSKNLVIVESPAKAKTIEKILGADFTVKSSMGHVRDLEKGDLGIDIQNNFKPSYIVTPDKAKIVKELKEQAKKHSEVWLATDEDREGEAISWHLCKVLGLDERITKRIVFREITKPAILKAVQNPRTIDLALVDAQQARRVLDRLVGYELSELLWRKIKGGLSAGRVQSVAVKLVVEREREIQGFQTKPFFRIEAQFAVPNGARVVTLHAASPEKFDEQGAAEDFLKRCIGANYTIDKIEVKPFKRKPTAPFTTSTLQQEASRKLGFSVNRTMQNAQRLYEQGHITYMRTDSTNLSELAIADIAAEIEKSYGKNYVQTRRYKTGKESAQEAHEAIRPTYIERRIASEQRDEQRLYELIWKRAIASQMADAELERTVVDINISTFNSASQINKSVTGKRTAPLVAEGEALKFDGFLKVYLESRDEEDEDAKGILPPLSVGQVLDFSEMTATERFTRPPARFTEASLVKQLEEQGIGRPSTYAPTITKIMEENRGYVIKDTRDGVQRTFVVLKLDKKGAIKKETSSEITGAAKNHLFPTDMGMLVVDFLDKHFEQIMNYGFTAGVENQLDDIADGKRNWAEMMGKFYFPFHEDVEKTRAEAERASGERILGVDPVSGRTVLVRMAKFGPVAQIGAAGELEESDKPQYANLKPGQSLETIELAQALKLFDLPRSLGEHAGQEVTVGIGRFGPYVKFGDTFVSIPKGEDPLSIPLDRAVELWEAKMKAEAPVFTYQEKPITKGSGRFGPFIKWNDMYINVPKKYDLETLTLDQAAELIDAKSVKESQRYIHQWDAEKILVENGRWGPFIRFNKKNMIQLKQEGKKLTAEEAATLTLDQVKKIIEAEIPDAFKKKTAAPKTAVAKSATAKTAAPKAAAGKAPASKFKK